MKNRFSKSLLSLILALSILIAVIAVGVVNVSSAEVDVAETGDGYMDVWFTNPSNWGTPYVHYWGGSSSSLWPGEKMTWKYSNDYGQGVYYYAVPANTTGLIFSNNGASKTSDTTVSGSPAVVAYYYDNGTAKPWTTLPSPNEEKYQLSIGSSTVDITSGTASVTMTAGQHLYYVITTINGSTSQGSRQYYTFPSDGTYKATLNKSTRTCTFEKQEPASVYFADNTEQKWIAGDDAVITANGVKMDKTVDEHTGWTVWKASIGIENGASLTYKRVSKLDNSDVWNTWTTAYDNNNPCYVATSDTAGNKGTAPTIPAGTATDYWYGIWADPKGNGNVKDFIKLYATDLYGSTDYYLYLPSYANRSALTIYTSLYDLKIGSTSVPRATATTVNLSSAAYNLSFKRYTGGSTHSDFKLHVMQTTGTSALLLTTKVDLYANTTSAYAVKEDGSTPDFDMIADYKSSTSTKGDYLCYDATGKLLNPKDKTTDEYLTGLKKIKGRGNSTFEASMRLYGKYAYNITLSDKAKLIEGCESQKKYSLLANNADESLMRNVTVYSIADEIGMPYTPNTRLVDMYDNGNYIGAYVLTEKVEYGKNTLIPDAKSLDKFNEDILAAGKGIDYDKLKQVKGTYTAKSGTKYEYQYSVASETGKTYEFDGTTVTIGEGEDAETYTLDETTMKKYDFLLEHELASRYAPEGTWFISDRTGQALVPKYPEFATQKEVQWMIEEYDALETAVFAGNYATVSQLADVETFADVYLIQELTMNLDACATSYNILGGGSFDKLLAAPLWDYDWTSGQYNGKKLTTTGEVDVADYTKVFVKNKSVKVDDKDERTQTIPNLQAKMTQMTDFWTLCKTEWTNNFVPVLNKYLGDNGTLLTYRLPEFSSAANMNESRWHAMKKNYEGARSSDPMAATWGTRSTSGYSKGSNNFGIGTFVAGNGTSSYENTVYFLNDWLQKRQNTMSTTMGLYDASLIIPDEPTEPETEPPTTPPTEPETEPPTTPPTTPPTEPPTTPSTEPETEPVTEAPETYLVGDVDGDGIISIFDATVVQRILAGYSVEDKERAEIRGRITDPSRLTIYDATVIQRFLAGFTDTYGINTFKAYPV